jgi:hypothetical protein
MRLAVALATLVMLVRAASADEPRPVVRAQVNTARVDPAPPDPSTSIRAVAPIKPPPRPVSLTLRQGVVSAHLAFEMSVTRDAVLAPASIAPDLSVGVLDRLTFSAISSGSAMTGFRGGAGYGVCIRDTDANCRSHYSGGGGELLLSLTRGSAAFALNGGLLATAIEPSLHTDLKLGFKLKLTEGNVSALFAPSVWLPLDARDDTVVPHEKLLFVPISVWVKTQSPFSIGLGTGVKGPVKDFKDRMAIPLGLLGQYAIDSHFTIGSSFIFGKLFGGEAVMDPGIDARVVQVWLVVTSG